jgi:hypothetical protein
MNLRLGHFEAGFGEILISHEVSLNLCVLVIEGYVQSILELFELIVHVLDSFVKFRLELLLEILESLFLLLLLYAFCFFLSFSFDLFFFLLHSKLLSFFIFFLLFFFLFEIFNLSLSEKLFLDFLLLNDGLC